jgi:hypothetical protein
MLRLMAVPIQPESRVVSKAGVPKPLFKFHELTFVPQDNGFALQRCRQRLAAIW